jgi:DNA-binding LacI/PurR family transcriptional regulator
MRERQESRLQSRVSLGDVAQRAGVSPQTVSRVVNGRPKVSAATRDRVLASMAELGYRPNVAARALRAGAFRSLGIAVFNMETLGNVRTIAGIIDEAARRGYAIEIMQIQTTHGDSTASGVSSVLTRFGENAVDGIVIIIESHLISDYSIELPDTVPSIIIESGVRADRPSVSADQEQGAEMAVRHLLGLGHPTVWHVAGPTPSNSAQARMAAWRRVLEQRGAHVPEPLVGDWSAESGYRAGVNLARDPDVTAVFAANDQMALGVVHALTDAGRRVPADVSVVGFDDMIEAAHFLPPLTTVRQDFEASGRLAVGLVLDAVEGKPVAPGPRLLDTRLIVRSSTGAFTPPIAPSQ